MLFSSFEWSVAQTAVLSNLYVDASGGIWSFQSRPR